MGLNDKYKNARSQILNTDPLPNSLSRVYAQVAQEKRQQLIVETRLPFVDAATFLTNSFSKFNNNRKSTSNHDLSKLFCDHCKRMKHTTETCFELHGYPEWWDKGKKSLKPKTSNNTQHMEKTEGNNTVPITGLMNEQYAQLISMLNLDKSHAFTANFVGTTNFGGNAIFLPSNKNQ
jgi:glutaredoxin